MEFAILGALWAIPGAITMAFALRARRTNKDLDERWEEKEDTFPRWFIIAATVIYWPYVAYQVQKMLSEE